MKPAHLLLAGLLAATCVRTAAAAPTVYLAEFDGVIHPVSVEYMVETMDRADAAGAALTVFILRTPGGLVDSTRTIVARMLRASSPVAIFIAPSGARAASAGFILTIAADIAAMAPGTHIGAAHPVAGGGQAMDETMSKKAAQDVAAYARTLAEGRHRNAALADQAVMESKAFTEHEATAASPPLVDAIATDVPDLLRQLDGRTIRRFDGSETVLHTAGASVVEVEMSLRQQVLSAIAHPNIAYLLLSVGMLGLTIELWTPGAVLPGVVGALSLLLAAFALQLLPINSVGLLLMLFGLLLFALEIKVTSYGLLTVGGAVSLVLGGLMLMDPAATDLRVSMSVVVPVVAAFLLVAGFLVRLAVAAQRQPAVSGAGGMIGESGCALSAIAGRAGGRIAVRGEIWTAVADEAIDEGARVKVVGMDGLTLTVVKERG